MTCRPARSGRMVTEGRKEVRTDLLHLATVRACARWAEMSIIHIYIYIYCESEFAKALDYYISRHLSSSSYNMRSRIRQVLDFISGAANTGRGGH
jgi:hypothetical protein